MNERQSADHYMFAEEAGIQLPPLKVQSSARDELYAAAENLLDKLRDIEILMEPEVQQALDRLEAAVKL